ncbi:FAD binding domain-containing protein [Bacillus sp. Marseille-P3661]|uniref:FAD binding domain-containing protein n=1 Tax=Bacillus sp. Marseille-P3661 TaxID=1936234 RepID=UPI000C840C21|nr:xanthine dehydrogenase family protein subunit M [Bacillus sp. Marseille-P3661]
MKPSKFEFYQPKTVEETLQLLEDMGEDAKIIAGGQSLVPIMNMRLATPKNLIDINRLVDLDFIENDETTLRIGTLTRQSRVEESSIVRKYAGLLSEAVPNIGHIQTRNRGTVGGSVVHADPSAEIPLSLMALNGAVKISSVDEERIVEAGDFFITYLTTDIMPTEMLTEVHIPIIGGRQGYAFTEFARKHGDFALVAAACHLTIDDSDNIDTVRLVLGGVEAIPFLIEDAEEELKGEKISDTLLDKIADIVADEVDPESDIHASADYRRHLAKILTKRTLQQAYNRARG